jgi:hypothetical protein
MRLKTHVRPDGTTNAVLDPIGKIPEYKVCAVKVEKLR